MKIDRVSVTKELLEEVVSDSVRRYYIGEEARRGKARRGKEKETCYHHVPGTRYAFACDYTIPEN